MNLHLNDNSAINKDDKLFKVRPYTELLNKKFQQVTVHKTNLSIEQMIPYRGRHSARMFCKGKPIRFGCKAWTLASSDGYVYGFDGQIKQRKELLRAPLDLDVFVILFDHSGHCFLLSAFFVFFYCSYFIYLNQTHGS